MRRRWTRWLVTTVLGALLVVGSVPGVSAPAPLGAQGASDRSQEVNFGALLRAGFGVGRSDLAERDGFRIHDARFRADGKIGIVFRYFAQAEYDPAKDAFHLLDARLRLPLSSAVDLDLGLFKAPFGGEALRELGGITFLRRSQATRVLAPDRQVGIQVGGQALENRLTYRAGVFNGDGRSLENDGDAFLYAGRVAFNSVGGAEFHDELAVKVGLSAAAAADSAANLRQAGDRWIGGRVNAGSFDGNRLLAGADGEVSYRGFFLRGEYLWAEFEPSAISPASVNARGGYVEGGYNLWGAIEGVVRYDAMDEFVRTVRGRRPDLAEGDGPKFLVVGLNLFPGYHTKFGLQYAEGLDGTAVGPGLSDGEFQIYAQVDFQ